MVANAGTIEAQLILNASNFQKQMQAAMADINKLNKNVTSAGSAATKSFSGAGESLTAFDKKLNTAQSHASALGNALTKEAKKISSALSSITPGDALAKQFNLGSRSILTMRNEAIAFNKEFRRLDSVAQNMGKQMKGAYPIEHIEKASLAQQKLNKQVIEASSSFAATGRSFQAAQAPIAGTGNAISNAFQKGGNAITKMGNSLSTLTNSVVSFNVWMGALVGKVFYDFTVGAAMARDESLSLFKFVGMSANEVNRLRDATDKYAQSASKVSQPEMLSAWKLVRISHKLTADQMIKNQDILGDTIGLFKSNGRTAEDAGRAIEDAMAGGADGIKRLKEIGITSMKELTDRGFDPSKPETFFQALRKIYTDRGIIGYGMKVTSLADRFENLKEKLELVGIAAGEALMPILEIIVSGFTAVFNVIPKQISGVALAFTGLAVILGFFWDTLKVLGSGLKMVVGHLIQFSGGTLIAADSAKKASASNFLLGKSLQSIQAGVAGAAIGIAAGVAIGAGMLHLYSELTSASKEWAKIDEQRNKQVSAFANTEKYLNSQLAAQRAERDRLISKGESTLEINKQIEETELAIANNTKASADAQERYNDAKAVEKGLIDLNVSRQNTADARSAEIRKKLFPDDPEAGVGDPAYRIALEKTAKQQSIISAWKFKRTGTEQRILEGDDNYAKIWKENDKALKEYIHDYDELIYYAEEFQKASEEGNWGGMAWFGFNQMGTHFNIMLNEWVVSIQSFIRDAQDWIKGAFGNTYKWLSSGWDWLVDGLGDAWNDLTSGISKAWDDVVNYFNDPTTIGGGIYDALKKVYCIIAGCSPGIIPALQDLWGWGKKVFDDLKAAVDPILQPFKDLWDIISKISSGDFSGLFGKGGALDFDLSGLIPDISLPKLKMPKMPDIKKMFKITGSFSLDSLSKKATDWVWSKINKITGGFSLSNLAIKGASWVWSKISKITGSFSLTGLANKAYDWIKSKIPPFHWPMGPGARAPRGPITDTIASTMATKSEVGEGYIRSALSKRFKGVSAFRDIANGMSDHLRYQFYFGDQKNNRQVWESGLCNCYDGAQFLVSEASQRFGINAGMQNGFWGKTPHTWSVIGGQNFDMAAKLIRGTWNPPRGPRDDFHTFMTEIGPGLEYLGYAGHLINPFDAVANGGNCFDMTLGIMRIANQLFGLPAEMKWGTYDGESHVWAKIGNRNYDPTRRALDGTWSPPPRGPGGRGGGNTYVFNGPVYNWKEFKRDVARANDQIVRR